MSAPANSVAVSPTVEDVKRIAAVEDPLLRNLLITQCYCELSAAFAKRGGARANWCSFATWASKQAGQTIRSEDLQRNIETLIKKQTGLDNAISAIILVIKSFKASRAIEQFHRCSFQIIVSDIAKRSADAVGRGNKKVFEEIGFEFARFISLCFADKEYNQENIDQFCEALRAGDPPEGQQWLRDAFRNYYRAFFETDPKKQAEACLLANVQIGFHEQTRLQPEIAEALNAATADTSSIEKELRITISGNAGFLARLRLFILRIFGRTSLLDAALKDFISTAQECIRQLLTAHLMTLTMPPGNQLQLGRDLALSYDNLLKEISDPGLLQLMKRIDPTPDSLSETGAFDWADLNERLHFIVDLFRCYHTRTEIFDAAFTEEQTVALKQNKIPTGKL